MNQLNSDSKINDNDTITQIDKEEAKVHRFNIDNDSNKKHRLSKSQKLKRMKTRLLTEHTQYHNKSENLLGNVIKTIISGKLKEKYIDYSEQEEKEQIELKLLGHETFNELGKFKKQYKN